MEGSSKNTFTEALAAARSGNRVKARNLLARLLKTDSSAVEYWVWMSSVVESKKEKIYCLESALKLDPTNRAVLRGLNILGARASTEAELASAGKLPRRHPRSISAGPAVGRALRLPWRFIGIGAGALVGVIILVVGVRAILPFFQPRGLSQAPTLPPLSPTPTETSAIPTATVTLAPASLRIMRTPVPTELALTPIVFFVDQTPTQTPVIGLTPHPYEAYSSGINAIVRGDYAAAISFFDQVLEFDDSFPDVHYFKGEALRLRAITDSGEEAGSLLGQAIGSYDRAVLLDSEFAPAYLGRGLTLLERTILRVGMDNLKAEDLPADFAKAIEVDPTFTGAYVAQAEFLQRVGLWKTLEESIQAAIDLGLRDPILYVQLAEAQINRQNYDTALENAIEGSASDHTMLDGYLMLGRALVRLERYPPAIDPLLTYVAYRGDDHRGWSDLGRAQLETGDLVSASSSIGQALTINPSYAPAYLTRGWLSLEVGAYETGLGEFGEARRFGRETFELFMGFGWSYFYLENWQEALNNANAAIEIAVQDQRKAVQQRLVSRGYALRATVSEAAPDLLDYAIDNWNWILELEFADPEIRAMAAEHLFILTGEAPTLAPSITPTITATPTPTPPGTALASPTPSLSPTPSVTPSITPTPSPTPAGTLTATPTPGTPTVTPTATSPIE
jgi:tetratricopeptide (TPR) repeat protein